MAGTPADLAVPTDFSAQPHGATGASITADGGGMNAQIHVHRD
jgi:hypothetical protein